MSDQNETSAPSEPKKGRTEKSDRSKESHSLDPLKLVSLCRSVPFHASVQTYCPSFFACGRVVEVACSMFTRTPKIVRDHPDFHPALIHLYIGTLWSIQVCRVMQRYNLVPPDMDAILGRHYDRIRNFKVPGIVVPFFNALASGQPSLSVGYKGICPLLPNTGYVDVNSASDEPQDHLLHVLPPLGPLRMNLDRAFQQIRNQGRNARVSVNNDVRLFAAPPTGVASGPLFDHTSANNWTSRGRICPGFTAPMRFIEGTTPVITVPLIDTLSFPDWPLDAADNYIDSLASFININELTWFYDLHDRVSWFADVFQSSKLLCDIPIEGPVIGQVIARSDVKVNRTQGETYRDMNGPILRLAAHGFTPQAKIDDGILWSAVFSQINWSAPKKFVVAGNLGRVGMPGNLLRGSFWTQQDTTYSSTAYPDEGLPDWIQSLLKI